MTKVARNKQAKREQLVAAALALFVNHGIEHTTIHHITTRAGVAKGTFYLYFKDKDDIVQTLLEMRTHVLVSDAVAHVKQHPDQFRGIDCVIGVVDFIVDYLTENKNTLRFIYKELSNGLLNETLVSANTNDETLIGFVCTSLQGAGITLSNPRVSLFMIVDLVGATCYNAIMFEKPLPIAAYKPFLFQAVRRLIY